MNALIRVTARYPDGEEVVVTLHSENVLQASFAEHLIIEGMRALGFGGAVQIAADGVTSGRSVSTPSPPCRTHYSPPPRSWWRRLVSGR